MGKSQPRSEKNRSVGDVMVKDVVSIEPSASLTDAARKMDDANVGMLPVVEDGKVLGVITDRDIVIRAVAREADPASTAVGDCVAGHAIVPASERTTARGTEAIAHGQGGRQAGLRGAGR